jgi:hypothetical protein
MQLAACLVPLLFRLGRESYEYMYAKPWSRVVDFYAMLVRTGAGAAGLADLFGKDEVRGKLYK